MPLLLQDPYNPYFAHSRNHPPETILRSLAHPGQEGLPYPRLGIILPKEAYPGEDDNCSGHHSILAYGHIRYPLDPVPYDYVDISIDPKRRVVLWVFKYKSGDPKHTFGYGFHAGIWLTKEYTEEGEAHHTVMISERDPSRKARIQLTDVCMALDTNVNVGAIPECEPYPVLAFPENRLKAVRDFMHNHTHDPRIRCDFWALWMVGEVMRLVLKEPAEVTAEKTEKVRTWFKLKPEGDEDQSDRFLSKYIDGRKEYYEANGEEPRETACPE